ncbi:MAG: DsbA family protein [Alphaproteobacteria bacterium]|nr:DsbA family protein [Alphaproteobacteria bacterium]
MTINRSTLMLLAGAVLMIAAVFLALQIASRVSSTDDVPATATSKADIERIVKNYLLEHPEIIFEAVERFQQKETDGRVAGMREGAKKFEAELNYEPDAIVAGNPKGDVTIVEFFDYRCGYCRKIVKDITTLLKQDGNIRLVLKEFPILSAESDLAARAAVASVAQGKYWDFHLALMEAEELSQESIFAIAKNTGIDVERLKVAMQSPGVIKTISNTQALAKKLGIDATPTFFIGGQPFSGALPLESLKEAVAAARKAKQS